MVIIILCIQWREFEIKFNPFFFKYKLQILFSSFNLNLIKKKCLFVKMIKQDLDNNHPIYFILNSIRNHFLIFK